MAIAPEAGPSRSSRVLKYSGHAHLRHRLVLSLLSRRPVRIDDIRASDQEPGLRECEVSFVRLLERISNGTLVEISYTGTSLLFSPGTLLGGHHTHACTLTRSVGWFLEPLLALAPFCKRSLSLTLRGITTDGEDASVDVLRLSCLPHLALFLPTADGLELKITKRGHAPEGGGEVTFACPSVKQVKPGFDFVAAGQISKIRGIAHSLRISPQTSNRLVSAARGVLNRFIPDIYIYTDVYRGQESGKSPGFAITLLATSTTGAVHSAEVCSKPRPSDGNTIETDQELQTPEDLATNAAYLLLNEIEKGACIDSGCESFVSTLMTLGREGDVVRCSTSGPLTPFLVQHLRDLRDFLGATFKITERPGTDADLPPTIQLACIGNGYVNVAAKTS